MIALCIGLVALAVGLVLAARVLAVGIMHGADALRDGAATVRDVNLSVTHHAPAILGDALHDVGVAWIDAAAKHAVALVRLSQLGVSEIPKATTLTGSPDPEGEARAAVRQRAIERGAAELKDRAQSIGAHISDTEALERAAQFVSTYESASIT